MKKEKILIAIIMGSSSDWKIMQDSAKILDKLKIKYEVKVLSAHRSPKLLFNYANSLEKSGIEVIIAGAGGAAALPGVLASLTTLPIIGVPIDSSALKGIDALYSIVQMPPGVPVATVGINSAKNAAILALQILSIKYKEIKNKLKNLKKEQEEKVKKAKI